ncbi:transcription factor TGA1-like [Phalaenopsis equestris]|uniref:transcription factor TGA1-like n=1 Tax=Phalaenopsis equestris TaxID=78828 RepID=UPI0009E23E4E|nr:transcription factor TGA1-like [Phalaenopsis equestris]XP_020577096.1 transcription factor TGA1-like [Phalaenopsis equestris]XP_020577097.1 transcription factor TGA1-like [Phalaenopsis equestris]
MEIYESKNHNGLWGDSLKADSSQNTCLSTIVEADDRKKNRSKDAPRDTVGTARFYDQEANKSSDKVLRRLAQNREAARKSRLRKKAYVQQLESSRIKLAQVEQELETTKQQGLYVGRHMGDSSPFGTINPGVAAFEMEYGHWVEEQNRQICELRAVLQTHVSEIELRMLVESGMNHYYDLFRIKAIAAKSDVFYLMSGLWRTASERFFLWIGGFRPSELLKVLTPQFDPLTEQQVVAVCNLQQSSQQAEDALSQGLDKLQQTLAEILTREPLGSSGTENYMENYMGQMANAMGQLDALIGFVNQADHLRQQTMQQMYKILTTRQVARGLLALGDYFQRLRALSLLWEARPCEPA